MQRSQGPSRAGHIETGRAKRAGANLANDDKSLTSAVGRPRNLQGYPHSNREEEEGEEAELALIKINLRYAFN